MSEVARPRQLKTLDRYWTNRKHFSLRLFRPFVAPTSPIDHRPGERLNRLVREYFPELTTILEETTCKIRFEIVPVSNIRRLEVSHNRAKPERGGQESIIIFSHQGRSVVVDGNNRVNVYLSSNECKPMPAIIIELR